MPVPLQRSIFQNWHISIMPLRFHYDKTEVINALRFHFMSRGEIKVFQVALMILIVSAFIGYWMDLINLQVVVWLFLLFIVLILIFWFILPHSVYKKARTFREPEIHLDCDEQSLSIGTQSGNHSIPWNRFERIVETKDFFYLYQNNKTFFLVPAKVFKDESERKEFSDLLRRHFRNYAVKKQGY